MLNRFKQLLQKNKQLIFYLFFGVCTTLINTVCYGLLYECLEVNNVISTIIAWLLAVIFAFVTNKRLVFESQSGSGKELVRELVSFFGCRLATGVLDVIIMVIAVDIMGWHSLVWKLIANVIVIVINYVVSKWIIFRK